MTKYLPLWSHATMTRWRHCVNGEPTSLEEARREAAREMAMDCAYLSPVRVGVAAACIRAAEPGEIITVADGTLSPWQYCVLAEGAEAPLGKGMEWRGNGDD